MLQEQGYYTACIGKWHLGWSWSTSDGSSVNDSVAIGTQNGHPYRRNFANKVDFTQPIKGGPTERGFNYYFGDDVPNFPPYTFFENDHLVALPDTVTAPGEFGSPGPKLTGWSREAVMPALTSRAVEFITSPPNDPRFHRKREQPFFIYFPLTAPHTPIAPDQSFSGKSSAGRYGDYVNQVDWTVGQIIQALEKTGQLENTVIIFTSDNGSPERDGTNYSGVVGSVKAYGHSPNYTWRGTKSEIWEGGHRVPFLIRWPGHVTERSVSDKTICHIDILASVADLLDIEIPDKGAPDSHSMLPLWLGMEEGFHRPEPIVLHSINGMFALRRENWIFIDGKGSGGWSGDRNPDEWPGQLYNLVADPEETNNLFASEPDRVEKMRLELERIKK